MTGHLNPQPGNWVLIRAQVVDEPTPPENVVVELFSKTNQYTAPVRRDLVVDVVPAPLPPEPDDLAVVLVDGQAYQRLTGLWYRAGSRDSYTWDGLCRLGKPEVVSWP